MTESMAAEALRAPRARDTRLPATDEPLTERVLAGLPGPRWRWIAAWAALPLVRLALHFAGAPIGTPEMWSSYVFAGVVPAVVYSLAVAYSLWITPRIVRQAVELEPVLERLGAPGVKVAPGATSTRGPLTLTAVFCLLTGIPGVINHGLPAAVAVPVVFAVDLALFNALWVYLTVVVGLDHIGRGRLELDPFPEDRSLGLRPVGALAVSSLRAFLIVVLPVQFVSSGGAVGSVLSALTLVVGLAAFLYSVYRLHRQMVAAKRRYVAWAHGLYASAYATVRSGDTLEGLRAQGSLLSAAEAMERRAESIHQWPFADRTFTWIATVATGVLVAIITRYVLREIGL